MASSNTPANDKGDEQVPTESANKRKRESVAANININDDTTEFGSKHVSAVETTDHVKEVEMKDAESIEGSVDQSQSVKEIEMQDADQVSCNRTGPNEGSKEDEELKKDEISENSEKESNDEDGSGQHVLGEVATLLKQVQESDSKAKLEVEVKVKKMEDVDGKENSEANEVVPNRGSGLFG